MAEDFRKRRMIEQQKAAAGAGSTQKQLPVTSKKTEGAGKPKKSENQAPQAPKVVKMAEPASKQSSKQIERVSVSVQKPASRMTSLKMYERLLQLDFRISTENYLFRDMDPSIKSRLSNLLNILKGFDEKTPQKILRETSSEVEKVVKDFKTFEYQKKKMEKIFITDFDKATGIVKAGSNRLAMVVFEKNMRPEDDLRGKEYEPRETVAHALEQFEKALPFFDVNSTFLTETYQKMKKNGWFMDTVNQFPALKAKMGDIGQRLGSA